MYFFIGNWADFAYFAKYYLQINIHEFLSFCLVLARLKLSCKNSQHNSHVSFHSLYLTPIQINGGSIWRACTISKFDRNYCYNQYSGSNTQNNGYCSWCLSFLHSNSGCKRIRSACYVQLEKCIEFRWFYFANMTTTQFAWSITFPTVYINNVRKLQWIKNGSYHIIVVLQHFLNCIKK